MASADVVFLCFSLVLSNFEVFSLVFLIFDVFAVFRSQTLIRSGSYVFSPAFFNFKCFPRFSFPQHKTFKAITKSSSFVAPSETALAVADGIGYRTVPKC